ncbi:Peptide alpha-N-acetyltransferase [Bertholletia excelsa]
MGFKEPIIRSYNGQIDKARVEELGRRCEVGPAQHVLFTETMGDPICRIRNSPLHSMLVAEVDNELVGVIQGSIKMVTLNKDVNKVGYILGLRVSPPYRHRGIGTSLVRNLQQWFVANQVDYAYMATEKDNEASINLFVNKFGFVRFRTPAILVQPVSRRLSRLEPGVDVARLRVEQAEFLYKTFMGSTDFFPHDIDNVLRNKLSLGTWMAYPRGESFGVDQGRLPNSWAMLSVWNSGELFRLRIGKAPLSCCLYEACSRLMDRTFPCFKVPELPDFFDPFGFYFLYGLHREGPGSGPLVRTLCKFVHNMAMKSRECKIIVTEIGGGDKLRLHIPHWKLLSCPEDLWCIKALGRNSLHDLTRDPPTRALFVDPREV